MDIQIGIVDDAEAATKASKSRGARGDLGASRG